MLVEPQFPLTTHGNVISARGTLAMCASAELAAEITARINASEMLQSMAAPEIVSGEPEPIPELVYFHDGNFYGMQSRRGQRQEFFDKWFSRRNEFPSSPADEPGWGLGAIA
jgi:hypothetical protein